MRFTLAQRRARLAVRHRLAAPAGSAVEAARGVVALHATDPASVFLAVHARTEGVAPADVERELYDERALVRLTGMRRTMFVVPAELAPVVHAAATRAIAETQRRRYLGLMEEAGLGDGDWLRDVERETLEALRRLGEATGAQLSAEVPRLRSKVLLSPGKKYESLSSITTWVLFLLAADGHIVRGRPLGSWGGTQYRWVPHDGFGELPAEEARVELARRWLERFGPGTVADLKWWTGWSLGHTRKALAALTVEEAGDGLLVLAGDAEPEDDPAPWVALLPALDPTAMGWQDRTWFLDDALRPQLFDRNGNVGPTVWAGGRVVGGWAQRHDGEIALRLLEDVGADETAAIEARAADLREWIGDVRFIPRFPTPLERELRS